MTKAEFREYWKAWYHRHRVQQLKVRRAYYVAHRAAQLEYQRNYNRARGLVKVAIL